MMVSDSADTKQRILNEVVGRGLCVGCGACIVDTDTGSARMIRSTDSLVPSFDDQDAPIDRVLWEACPGKGVDYPWLYHAHYGRFPDDWRAGIVERLWTGFAADPAIRAAGASGGVLTAVLMHLMRLGQIDAAVCVKQGHPRAEDASYSIARTPEEILSCAQSVYIPVSVLDAMRDFVPGERYAMTCVPEQAAALRVLQHRGHSAAQQVKYVVGPYTGTALDSGVISAILRAHNVAPRDYITSLRWREGEWPGYLQIRLASGRVIRSKKVYYNYLIPFYVTQASLQSMDFANEFTDLSVGDAWAPTYERAGQGFSVIAARTPAVAKIVSEMADDGLLTLESADPLEASSMHGHMIDFKKRGGYLRNSLRRSLRVPAADFGLRPLRVGALRIAVELVVSSLFLICRTRPARLLVQQLPEDHLGPIFDRLRLTWKALSKPAKRKGLRNLRMKTYRPRWTDPND